MLTFEGSSLFRHYIAASVVTHRPITIVNIHASGLAGAAPGAAPCGIQDYESNYLKFVDKLTTGSEFEVKDDNTTLIFRPGYPVGGRFTHAVTPSRCVSYVMEAAVLMLPFAKFASEITFTGSTQSPDDLSVDTFRTVTAKLVELFGVRCSVRCVSKGAAPGGGGCAILACDNVRRLRSVTVVERGKVKRVRGIAFGSNVAPDLLKRCATGAKGVLLQFLPDVYVVTDESAKKERDRESGRGYGVVLVAETTSKTCILSQESNACGQEPPELVGERASRLLLDQIAAGGCVDGHHQQLVLMMMAASPDDVSCVRLGRLTPSAISAMVILEKMYSVTCATKEEPSSSLPPSVMISCLGANYVNVAKKSG